MTPGSPDPARREPTAGRVLFGPFDRHNLGDLLFAHFAPDRGTARASCSLAGLVDADLRRFGGHVVRNLAGLLAEAPARPVDLVHAGGEILTCDRWAARVMTLAPETARDVVRCFDRNVETRTAWLDGQAGFESPAPYVIRRSDRPAGSRVEFRAVGGVGLSSCDPALRAHLLQALFEAQRVSVRDRTTLETLAVAGIRATLEADPVSHIREQYGVSILKRCRASDAGCLAVQLGAEFGDDASLGLLAEQIRRVALGRNLPVVLFRAAAAPWHDDPDALRRLAAMLDGFRIGLFGSLDIWDVCALIARARAVLASSLHARIVAEAFGRPSVSLVQADAASTGQAAKVSAYVTTWYPGAARLAPPAGVGRCLDEALDATRPE